MKFSRISRRSWALALIGLLGAASMAQAQEKIYYQVGSNNIHERATQLWAMNTNGSNRVNLFPNGLGIPAPYDEELFGIAGPSRQLYPIDPNDPDSPQVAWWVAFTRRIEGDPSGAIRDLFAFAPDGQGGAVWRQLTDLAGTGLVLKGSPELPNDGTDAFVSFAVEDRSTGFGTIRPHYYASLTDPFERAGPADPTEFQPILSALLDDELSWGFNGHHTWSPDGSMLAYTFPYLDDQGRRRRQLRILHQNGADTLLLDGGATGIAIHSPRWSPDGTRIAFWNAYAGELETVYTVNVSTGQLLLLISGSQKGRTTTYYYFPIWSPDSRTLALQKVTRTSSQTSLSTYDREIVLIPSTGVRRERDAVSLLFAPWPAYVQAVSWR